MFPEKSNLTEKEIDTLPKELQGDDVDTDTKIEFYEAAKITRDAYLIRAKVIDSFYRRYSRNPDRAKHYSMKLIEIAHGELKLSTVKNWLSGYRNLGSLLNNADIGETLYEKLINTGWQCSATVKNPKFTYQQYMEAADKWEQLPQEEKKGHIGPGRIKELIDKGKKDNDRERKVQRQNPRRKENKSRNLQFRRAIPRSAENFIESDANPLQFEDEEQVLGDVSQKRKRDSDDDNKSVEPKPKKRRVTIDVNIMTKTMNECMKLARENERLELVQSIRTVAKMCELQIK